MKESMGKILTGLGIEERNLGGFCGEWMGSGPELSVTTPIDGSKVATVGQVTEEEYDAIVSRAHEAFLHWRTVPAPRRGELVRQIGDRLRRVKAELGALVTLEMGWGEGVRLRCLEGLHAVTDQHGQLEHGTAVGPGDRVRRVAWPPRGTDESCRAVARIER